MSMTVVATRNVSGRFRGFLASIMCEIGPGVYTAPRMNAGVRDRVWHVLESWWSLGADASIVMTWADSNLPGGQAVRLLGSGPGDSPDRGSARRELVDHDGIYLVRTPLNANELAKLGVPDPDVPF